jgi:alginate O-acetyltransferase complex protein AlgJ
MTDPPRGRTTLTDKVLVAMFVMVMTLPLAARLTHFEPATFNGENRRLAPFPPLSLSADSINAFPAAFEAYYSDHFGLRSHFIRWHHMLKLRLLHVSPSPSVVLGKDGWLFDEDTVAYYRALPLSAEELEKWRKFLEEREEFVAAEGAACFQVIAPSPCSIYPEYLPDSVRRHERETRLDQILNYMRRYSRVKILDLRAALLEAKSTGRLYNRTDTHWNDLGAYVAYREIMRAVAGRIPGCDPLPPNAFDIRRESAPGGDIARLLALPDLIPEEQVRLVPRALRRSRVAEWLPEGSAPPAAFCMKLDDLSRPRAIVFHDSFTYASLYPFLAEHFSEIWFHWNHYFEPGLRTQLWSQARGDFLWNPGMMDAPSQAQKPLIVIVEIAERQMLYDPPPTWREIQ